MSRLWLSLHIFRHIYHADMPDRTWWSIRAIVAKARWLHAMFHGSKVEDVEVMVTWWSLLGNTRFPQNLAMCRSGTMPHACFSWRSFQTQMLQGKGVAGRKVHGRSGMDQRYQRLLVFKESYTAFCNLSTWTQFKMVISHQWKYFETHLLVVRAIWRTFFVSLGDPDDSAQVILDCKEHNVALYEKHLSQGFSPMAATQTHIQIQYKHGGFLRWGLPPNHPF